MGSIVLQMMHRIQMCCYSSLHFVIEYFRSYTCKTEPHDRFTFSVPYLPLGVDTKYRPDIDGLRAIAVSAVVLFHAFPTHLTGGFVGVDIFFVISGYLISSIIYHELDKGSFSFVEFYSRRVRRIFPSLLIILIACYLAGWYLFLAAEYKKLGAHIVAAASFSSNFLLYRESGYFDSASYTKPLLHLWSLGIEEQFYIIWPVLLYHLWKTKLNLLTITVGLTLSSFTLNIITVKTNKVQTFYWPTTRAWELLIGACLASRLIYTNKHVENYKRQLDDLLTALIYREPFESNGTTLCNVTSTVGILLTVLPMYFLTEVSVFPGWWAVAPTIGTALLILAGPASWFNRNILSSCLLVGIGRISYPLYLWHWPLLTYTRIFIGQESSYYIRAAIISLSIILAWITDAYIEKLFRFGRLLKVKFIFLCFFMAGLGFMGYLTYRANGLPTRFAQVIGNAIDDENNVTDISVVWRQRTCLLEGDQNEAQFGACVDNKEKPTSLGVTLWGDSHAAHLYPGIAATKPVVRVSQLTFTGCPAMLEFQRDGAPYCKQNNDYVFKRISDEKPNTVILSARWAKHDWRNYLINTIANLKNASIKNIYLVGPIPEWQDSLARCLYKYSLDDTLHRVPNRLQTCLVPGIDDLDKTIDTLATETNVSYISLYKILCNSEGCLTSIGRNNSKLTMHDGNHLSVSGSIFVVSHFPDTLLRFLLQGWR